MNSFWSFNEVINVSEALRHTKKKLDEKVLLIKNLMIKEAPAKSEIPQQAPAKIEKILDAPARPEKTQHAPATIERTLDAPASNSLATVTPCDSLAPQSKEPFPLIMSWVHKFVDMKIQDVAMKWRQWDPGVLNYIEQEKMEQDDDQ